MAATAWTGLHGHRHLVPHSTGQVQQHATSKEDHGAPDGQTSPGTSKVAEDRKQRPVLVVILFSQVSYLPSTGLFLLAGARAKRAPRRDAGAGERVKEDQHALDSRHAQHRLAHYAATHGLPHDGRASGKVTLGGRGAVKRKWMPRGPQQSCRSRVVAGRAPRHPRD